MGCYSCCCGGLYRCKGVLFKLILPLMLIDLALTLYLVIQLSTLDVFACCTDNTVTYGDICSYVRLRHLYFSPFSLSTTTNDKNKTG